MPAHDFLGRDEAQALAGIAVVLMLFHHFFGFDSYMLDGVSYVPSFSVLGITAERMVAAFGKICVSIFAFSSGYAAYKFRTQYGRYGLLARRGLRFLLSYWMVLLCFLFFAILTSDTLPTHVNLAYNIIGLATSPDRPYINVTFAWYVSYYLVFLLLIPIVLAGLSTKHLWTDILVLCGVAVLVEITQYTSIGYVLLPLTTGVMGAVCCKWQIFNRLSSHRILQSSLFASLAIVLLAISRQLLILLTNLEGWFEPFITCLFVFFTVILFNKLGNGVLCRIILGIGSMSMYIWFLHGIFFTGHRVLQPLVYAPRLSILIIAFVLVMLWPVSWVLDKTNTKLIKLLGL